LAKKKDEHVASLDVVDPQDSFKSEIIKILKKTFHSCDGIWTQHTHLKWP
jgi:hypothetical protein